MKKVLLVLCLLLSLCGCQSQKDPLSDNDTVALPFSEPISMQFLSGAGGWFTEILLYPDGSFTGNFHDSNMGDIDTDYPHGTVLVCAFEGRFVNFQKISETQYSMNLVELTPKDAPGKVWIEDQVRYIASTPYGLETDNKEACFYLFTPDTPTATLSDSFLSWWPNRYESPQPQALSCYGIFNVEQETGFFSDPLSNNQ